MFINLASECILIGVYVILRGLSSRHGSIQFDILWRIFFLEIEYVNFESLVI